MNNDSQTGLPAAGPWRTDEPPDYQAALALLKEVKLQDGIALVNFYQGFCDFRDDFGEWVRASLDDYVVAWAPINMPKKLEEKPSANPAE